MDDRVPDVDTINARANAANRCAAVLDTIDDGSKVAVLRALAAQYRLVDDVRTVSHRKAKWAR